MARLFIPSTWRLKRVVWALMVFELPFTVANLVLFGIASPDTYRTILWREGGERGFNSDPTTVLYAYANYRPVAIPLIWSYFNTRYHLVIGVLGLFFYLVKATMWLLGVFYPLVSLLLHIGLLTIWAYGIHIQTSPDTIDPTRINRGAPWYITKSCTIVEDKYIRNYCMQAKSAFAISVLMLITYAIFILLSAYSLFPTTTQRQAHQAKRAERKAEKEKWASYSDTDNDRSAEEQWQHMWELQQLPRSPGPQPKAVANNNNNNPITPRTQAFNSLDASAAANGSSSKQWYTGQEAAAAVQPVHHHHPAGSQLPETMTAPGKGKEKENSL